MLSFRLVGDARGGNARGWDDAWMGMGVKGRWWHRWRFLPPATGRHVSGMLFGIFCLVEWGWL
jgi:hypothetical protein